MVKKYILLNSKGNKNGHSFMINPHQGGVQRLTTVNGSCSCVDSLAVSFAFVKASTGRDAPREERLIVCNTRSKDMSCCTSNVMPSSTVELSLFDHEGGEEEEEEAEEEEAEDEEDEEDDEEEEEEKEISSVKESRRCKVVLLAMVGLVPKVMSCSLPQTSFSGGSCMFKGTWYLYRYNTSNTVIESLMSTPFS